MNVRPAAILLWPLGGAVGAVSEAGVPAVGLVVAALLLLPKAVATAGTSVGAFTPQLLPSKASLVLGVAVNGQDKLPASPKEPNNGVVAGAVAGLEEGAPVLLPKRGAVVVLAIGVSAAAALPKPKEVMVTEGAAGVNTAAPVLPPKSGVVAGAAAGLVAETALLLPNSGVLEVMPEAGAAVALELDPAAPLLEPKNGAVGVFQHDWAGAAPKLKLKAALVFPSPVVSCKDNNGL